MIAVLDDDPTGSQTVYGATIVTALDELADDPLTFYLTNTRSLDEAEAARAHLRRRARGCSSPTRTSRSSAAATRRCAATCSPRCRRSTAPAATCSARATTASLLAPAFFEAGRSTRGDVHYAGDTPVGETEFAQDATFGYSSSNLVDFVAEKGGGDALSLVARRRAAAR